MTAVERLGGAFSTAVVSVVLVIGLGLVLALALPVVSAVIVAVVAAVVFAYALLAGAVGAYDLTKPLGWLCLVLDCTWSLTNTVFGAVIGGLVYLIFGNPSTTASKGQNWVSYAPRSSTGFGNDVLQTLGPVNLGGAGQHERMHLLQARIFGPLYLPLFAVFYIVTSLIQILFTLILGLALKAAHVRASACLRPPAESAVSGFFGWIYYATPFEVWAYASGNP
ncbi:MAG TPA: hypothetical protein VIM10_13145 [Actinopolymorphaceae bacterium]